MKSKRLIKVKTKKLINSFKYAFAGIVTSFKTERNMKIHVLIAALVLIFGVWLKINRMDNMCISNFHGYSFRTI